MSPTDITALLHRWTDGDRDSAERLLPLVYDDLRRRARSSMRSERSSHSLQPTALVHEAYMRFSSAVPATIENREHFFAMASKIMRQILVDHARKRFAKKRGGPEAIFVQVDEARDVAGSVSVLDLDGALKRLAVLDERQAQIIELRFFGGLSLAEVASVLDVSTATVNKETRKARAWLHREIFPHEPRDEAG